jgi:hypothetical protein
MTAVSLESVRDIHAQTSRDFGCYIVLGYSVSSEAMDKKGYHPVCVAGFQFKFADHDEEDDNTSPEDAPTSEGPLQHMAVASPLITSKSNEGFLKKFSLNATKHWSNIRKDFRSIVNNFPSKFYLSSSRLARSCVKTSAMLSRRLEWVWGEFWK